MKRSTFMVTKFAFGKKKKKKNPPPQIHQSGAARAAPFKNNSKIHGLLRLAAKDWRAAGHAADRPKRWRAPARGDGRRIHVPYPRAKGAVKKKFIKTEKKKKKKKTLEKKQGDAQALIYGGTYHCILTLLCHHHPPLPLPNSTESPRISSAVQARAAGLCDCGRLRRHEP
jgi:hypothetical protein